MTRFTEGRYAETGHPATLRSRLFWLRTRLAYIVLDPWRGPRIPLGNDRYGVGVAPEFGYWTVRPRTGLGSLRWITPPTAAARNLPRNADVLRAWGDSLNL